MIVGGAALQARLQTTRSVFIAVFNAAVLRRPGIRPRNTTARELIAAGSGAFGRCQ